MSKKLKALDPENQESINGAMSLIEDQEEEANNLAIAASNLANEAKVFEKRAKELAHESNRLPSMRWLVIPALILGATGFGVSKALTPISWEAAILVGVLVGVLTAASITMAHLIKQSCEKKSPQDEGVIKVGGNTDDFVKKEATKYDKSRTSSFDNKRSSTKPCWKWRTKNASVTKSTKKKPARMN